MSTTTDPKRRFVVACFGGPRAPCDEEQQWFAHALRYLLGATDSTTLVITDPSLACLAAAIDGATHVTFRDDGRVCHAGVPITKRWTALRVESGGTFDDQLAVIQTRWRAMIAGVEAASMAGRDVAFLRFDFHQKDLWNDFEVRQFYAPRIELAVERLRRTQPAAVVHDIPLIPYVECADVGIDPLR